MKIYDDVVIPLKEDIMADGTSAAPVVQDQAVKDAIVALFAVGGVIKQIVADKKVTISDLPLLMQVVPKVQLVAGELPAVKQQLTGMNDAEIADLAAYIMAQLGGIVESAKVVAQVLAVITVLEDVYKAYETFK